MAAAGRLLKDRGIAVDVLPAPKQVIKDAAVEELKVPAKLYQAESFYVEVMIRSTFKTSGELRIYEDNREIGRERVDVTPGENRYAVKGLAKNPGLHRYRAEIFMDGDEASANNAAFDFTRVEESSRCTARGQAAARAGRSASAAGRGVSQGSAIQSSFR